MHWGQRKDRGHEGQKASPRKIAKLDAKYAKNVKDYKTTVRVYNVAAMAANAHDVERINNLPKYKNADFTHDSPLRRQYYKDHQDAFLKRLQEAADLQGTNASGTKKYGIVDTGNGRWDITLVDVVQHSDVIGTVNLKFDSQGKIIEIVVPADSQMMQAERSIADFLAHFGVKGMHWGVHKSNPAVADGKAIAKNVATLQAHRRSSKGDVTRKAFAKNVNDKGGLHKVSDEELKRMLERLNMEKRYTDILNADAKRKQDYAELALKTIEEIGKVVIPAAIAGFAAYKTANAASAAGVFRTNTINPRVIEGVASYLNK